MEIKDENILTKSLRPSGLTGENYALPNPDKILQTAGGLSAYRDLKNDPHVWSCIQSRKSGLLSLHYEIVGEEHAAEIGEIIDKIDIYEVMRSILEAPLFGWQPLEVIWEYREMNGESQLCPSRVIARPHEWFTFRGDGTLLVRSSDGKYRGINPCKVLCPRFEATADNPYGHSLLAKCYWAVMFKSSAMQNWTKFCEKYGMPILVGQYTRGATGDEAQRLADALAAMNEDSVIVTPDDINITLHEAARGSSSELYRDLIKYCNAEISKAILSQTLTTELDMGSYAATETHFKIRREVILSDMQLVESTVNALLSEYARVNFGDCTVAKFRLQMN